MAARSRRARHQSRAEPGGQRAVAQPPGDLACICDLTAPLGLSQPTVSHHMKLLTEAGLVTREQRSKWAYYRVVPEAMAALGDTLRVTGR